MRKIYSNAATVRVWLTLEVNPADPAYNKLWFLQTIGDSGVGDEPEIWNSIAHIFLDPYWYRLWVQQELMLAREFEIHCRENVIRGSFILEFQQQLHQKTLLFQDDILARSRNLDLPSRWGKLMARMQVVGVPSKNISQWRHRFLSHQPDGGIPDLRQDPNYHQAVNQIQLGRGSLLNSLGGFQDLKVTDPKDRVIALLGLVTDCEDGDIKIDYTQSVATIYTNAVRFLVQKYRNLEPFCQIARSPSSSMPTYDLPSWVPDWNSGINIRLPFPSHQASGILPSLLNPIDLSGKSLQVQGIRLDCVSSIFPQLYETRQTMKQLTTGLMEVYAAAKAWHDPLGATNDDTSPIPPIVHNFAYSPEAYHDPVYEQLVKTLTSDFGTSDSWEATIKDKASAMHIIFFSAADPSCAEMSVYDFTQTPLIQTMASNLSTPIMSVVWTLNRGSPIVTTQGRIGLVTSAAVEEGDQIWILFGCPLPMVLRPGGGGQVALLLSVRLVLMGL